MGVAFSQEDFVSRSAAGKGSKGRWFAVGVGALLAVIAAGMLAPGSTARQENSRVGVSSLSLAAPSPALSPASRQRIAASYAALPLGFEPNQGQADPQVKYMARANGYTLFLTQSEAVFSFRAKSSSGIERAIGHGHRFSQPKAAGPEENETSTVGMRLVGGNPKAQLETREVLPGKTNYYVGNKPANWHANVPQYARVCYKDVYPGVDLAYYGDRSRLEFDFIVAPESSPEPIALAFSGTQGITTDASGDLVVSSAAGNAVLHKPVAYQKVNGGRQPVAARFALKQGNRVNFELGNYDHSRELIIDPSVVYATYLGGANEDEVFALAVDSANNVFVTGESDSTSGWPASAGGNVAASHSFDVFVTKLTSSGALSYTTFVGGSNADSGLAITVDSFHAAYVTGITQSTDFPVSGTAPQPTGGGGGNCTNTKKVSAPCSDAFAFKLDANGVSVWATYIGGSNDDDGYAIALDSAGNAWVAGDSFSGDFYPIGHASATLETNFNNGGTLNPPADDGFVVEINPAGTGPFLFATYLGGSFGDQINGIAIDSTNNVYVAGETNSTDFPTTTGAYQKTCGSDAKCNANGSTSFYDAFVTKIATGGASLSYSTYIGGSSDDYAFAIALDGSGNAYLTGETTNDDSSTTPAVPFPTTNGAFSTAYNAAASSNAFVTELNPAGSSLVYSSFLGGSVEDFGGGIAIDSFGDTYVTGMTQSADFPITSNAVQSQLNGNQSTAHSDAFVTQFLAGGSQLGFSSYLGGSMDENANASGAVGTIALDSARNIWIGGSTNSTDFPVTAATAAQPAFGGNPYDGFVTEISSATLPDFNITATSPGAVTPGTSGTSMVDLTSLFGYNSAVNLSCTVTGTGTPAPACSASSFSPGSVTPTTTGAMSTLTITTTGNSGSSLRRPRIFYALWLPIAGLSLAGMGFGSSGSRRRKLLGFMMIAAVMSALLLMPACGSTTTTTVTNTCPNCTPMGNYTITVTGTGTDANAITHSMQVILTVN